MQNIVLRAIMKVRDNAKRWLIGGAGVGRWGRAVGNWFSLLGNVLKWGLSDLQGTCHLQSPL